MGTAVRPGADPMGEALAKIRGQSTAPAGSTGSAGTTAPADAMDQALAKIRNVPGTTGDIDLRTAAPPTAPDPVARRLIPPGSGLPVAASDVTKAAGFSRKQLAPSPQSAPGYTPPVEQPYVPNKLERGVGQVANVVAAPFENPAAAIAGPPIQAAKDIKLLVRASAEQAARNELSRMGKDPDVIPHSYEDKDVALAAARLGSLAIAPGVSKVVGGMLANAGLSELVAGAAGGAAGAAVPGAAFNPEHPVAGAIGTGLFGAFLGGAGARAGRAAASPRLGGSAPSGAPSTPPSGDAVGPTPSTDAAQLKARAVAMAGRVNAHIEQGGTVDPIEAKSAEWITNNAHLAPPEFAKQLQSKAPEAANALTSPTRPGLLDEVLAQTERYGDVKKSLDELTGKTTPPANPKEAKARILDAAAITKASVDHFPDARADVPIADWVHQHAALPPEEFIDAFHAQTAPPAGAGVEPAGGGSQGGSQGTTVAGPGMSQKAGAAPSGGGPTTTNVTLDAEPPSPLDKVLGETERRAAVAPREYIPESSGLHTTEGQLVTRNIARALKQANPDAIAHAAPEMASRVPPNAILVPLPNHQGSTAANAALANAIAQQHGSSEVADVLTRSAPAPSAQELRQSGKPGPSAEEHAVTIARTPGADAVRSSGRPIVLIDNVETSGATAEGARRVLGAGADLVTFAKAPLPAGETRAEPSTNHAHEIVQQLGLEPQSIAFQPEQSAYRGETNPVNALAAAYDDLAGRATALETRTKTLEDGTNPTTGNSISAKQREHVALDVKRLAFAYQSGLERAAQVFGQPIADHLAAQFPNAPAPQSAPLSSPQSATPKKPAPRLGAGMVGKAIETVEKVSEKAKTATAAARTKVAGIISPELATEHRALSRAANTDALTGLGNQRAYGEAVQRAESDPHTSVIRFDLNGFKAVNDVVSHDAGDAALKAVATAIHTAAPGLPSYRVGGDEFAVFAPTATAAAVRDAIERAVGVHDVPGKTGTARYSISGGVGETNAAADEAAGARKQAHKAEQGIGPRGESAILEHAPSSASGSSAEPREGSSPQEGSAHRSDAAAVRGAPNADTGAPSLAQQIAALRADNERLKASAARQDAAVRAKRGGAPTVSIRDEFGGLRRNLTLVSLAELESERNRLAELNATEEAARAAVLAAGYREDYEALPSQEKTGRTRRTRDEHGNKLKKQAEDLPDADGMVDSDVLDADNNTLREYSRNTLVRQARDRAIDRLQLEIDRRRAQDDEGLDGRARNANGTLAPLGTVSDDALRTEYRIMVDGGGAAPTILAIEAEMLDRGIDRAEAYKQATEDLANQDPTSFKFGEPRAPGYGPDLFGNEPEPSVAEAQESLFADRAGTTQSRDLASTERAARAELDALRQRAPLETDPEKSVRIAQRIALLTKLVNRDAAISADELAARARAEPDAAPETPDQGAFFERAPHEYGVGRFLRRAGYALDNAGATFKMGFTADDLRPKSVEEATRHVRPAFDTAFTAWRRLQDDSPKHIAGDDMLRAFRGASQAAADAMNRLISWERSRAGWSRFWQASEVTGEQIQALAMDDADQLAMTLRGGGAAQKAFNSASALLNGLWWTISAFQSESPFIADAEKTISAARTEIARDVFGEDERGILPGDEHELEREENRRMLPRSTRVRERPPTYGGLYSRLERAIEHAPFDKGTAEQWQAALSKNVSKGEREWTGVESFLKDHPGDVLTRRDVANVFDRGNIALEETLYAEIPRTYDDHVNVASRALTAARTQLHEDIGRLLPATLPEAERAAAIGSIAYAATVPEGLKQLRAVVGRDLTERERSTVTNGFRKVTEATIAFDNASVASWQRFPAPKYADYTEPGGSNYREILIQLGSKVAPFDPAKVKIERRQRSATQGSYSLSYDGVSLGGGYDLARPSYTPVSEIETSGFLFSDDEIVDQVRKRYTTGGKWNGTLLRPGFSSSHFDAPNILAHVRADDRTLPNGEKVLFVEEIQSDWHQQGRERGYHSYSPTLAQAKEFFGIADDTWGAMPAERRQSYVDEMRDIGPGRNVVPDAPFKKTEEWLGLVMKRVIDEAVQGNYQRIAWTTGGQQADRYDLSKQVDRISYNPSTNELSAEQGGRQVHHGTYDPKAIASVIGKEPAKQLLAAPLVDGEYRDRLGAMTEASLQSISGADLSVGGQGMRTFYDDMIPSWVRDYGKKLGVPLAVEPADIFAQSDEGLYPWAVVSGEGPDGNPNILGRYATRAEAEQASENYLGAEFEYAPIPTTPAGMPANQSFRITPALRAKVEADGQAMWDRNRQQYNPDQGNLFVVSSDGERTPAASLPTEASIANPPDAELRAVRDTLQRAAAVGLPTEPVRRAQMEAAAKRNILDIRGRVVTTPEEWATLAQAFRHPAMEILSAALLNDDDLVVSHLIATSGELNWATLPDRWDREIAREAVRVGATHVVLMHNHPSGDPTASMDDVATTLQLSASLGDARIQLDGHVIINHNTATWLVPQTKRVFEAQQSTIDIPQYSGAEWQTAVEMGAPSIRSPRDVVRYAVDTASPNTATVLHLDAQHRLVAVEPRPLSQLDAAHEWLPESMRRNASAGVVIIAPHDNAHRFTGAVDEAQSAGQTAMTRTFAQPPIVEEHQWAYPVLDVIGMDYDAKTAGRPRTTSYSSLGRINSRPVEPRPAGATGVHRLAPGRPAAEQLAELRAREAAVSRRRLGASARPVSEADRVVEEEDLRQARHRADRLWLEGGKPMQNVLRRLESAKVALRAGRSVAFDIRMANAVMDNMERGRVSEPAPTYGQHSTPSPSGLSQDEPFRLGEIAPAIRALFNPESVSDASRGVAGTIRAERAIDVRQVEIATEALRQFGKALDTLTREQQIAYWDAAEHGESTGNAEFDRGNQLLHDITQGFTDQLVARGRLKAENTIEDYIGRFWTKPGANGRAVSNFIQRIMGRRPLEGPKSFLKHRSLENFTDGLDAGLVPATYNYVEAQLAKIAEMQRVVGATKMLNYEKSVGRAKVIMDGGTIPETEDGKPWVKIDPEGKDPAFTIFGPRSGAVILPDGINTTEADLDEEGEGGTRELKQRDVRVLGRRTMGHWYAPPEVAAVWKAHLSRGVRGVPGLGLLYRAYMAPANAATQIMLGFSGFHLTTIAREGINSRVALAIDSMANTRTPDPASALKHLANAVPAIAVDVAFGHKVMQEYRAPGMHPEMARVLDAMLEGGFRGTAENEFWTGEHITALKKSFHEAFKAQAIKSRIHAAASTAWEAPWAVIEASMKPIMGYYVPLMKTAATYRAAAQALESLPADVDLDTVRRTMTEITKEMDYRYGQVVYDNHFMHRVIKDLAQALFLAPGWTFGTLTLAGRGVSQIARIPGRLVRRVGGGGANGGGGGPGSGSGRLFGEPPDNVVGPSAAYWLGGVSVFMLVNGILTYLHTGEHPHGKDYFGYRDGTTDEDGNPNRHVLPGYEMRDIYSWGTHPITTVENKFKPVIAFAARLANNRTYFGDEIVNPDDPFATQVGQGLREARRELVTPLSRQNFVESQKRGEHGAGAIVQNLLGIGPAKREFQRTPAQNKMAEFLATRGHTARTPEAAAPVAGTADLTKQLRAGKIAMDSLDRMVDRGTLTEPQMDAIARAAEVPHLLAQFNRLSVNEARRVYALGQPWERELWKDSMDAKEDRADDLPVADPKPAVRLRSPVKQ